MKNSLILGASTLLVSAALPGPSVCEGAHHAFCADAQSADQGVIITRTARIEFEIGESELRLTIDDTRSGARTILDLPSVDANEAKDTPDRRPDRGD
ncbi:hypothetical protein I5L01_06110 [Erythrobacter sp. YJ-T3-07]|uniref:hypothetical protein n=1 Tax=Erythrobacter sp. YJ-T3-07 TaxID=2793063 RepID=UPI0018D43F9D|nr:hypothetical protein [Erythrobacter sp. YJ-T3-07]MBH1943807.1 hypothetical protein [Erythrobacter sp. YJ-T3-07]